MSRGCGRMVDIEGVGAGVTGPGMARLKGLRASKSPECLVLLCLLHSQQLYLLLCS